MLCTQLMNKLILAFPYHDPEGINNELFQKTLPILKEIFSDICIGATPPTVVHNALFLEWLEKEGCLIVRNEEDTNVGDHYRSALRIASDAGNGEATHICYGFLDRILFALNTEHVHEFIQDILDSTRRSITLFERSGAAWNSHPANYAGIEQALNKMGAYLIGHEVELGTCGFCMEKSLAEKIIAQSTATSFSAATEWILLSYLLGYSPFQKKCDWLIWEDPFIEKKDPAGLKKEREQDVTETVKRLKMNAGFLQILQDDRFKTLHS